MIRVYVYCEGDTEYTFVKNKLSEYLELHDIKLDVATNSRSGSHCHGVSSYASIKREIQHVCHEHPNEYVTTMLDFYGFPFSDFTDKDITIKKCDVIEKQIEEDLKCKNCLFHFDLCEFEAILFSDPAQFSRIDPKAKCKVEEIREQYPNPEDINSSYAHCPSRRLESIIEGYSKIIDSRILYSHLDLDKVREQCPHFNQWMTRICALKEKSIY